MLNSFSLQSQDLNLSIIYFEMNGFGLIQISCYRRSPLPQRAAFKCLFEPNGSTDTGYNLQQWLTNTLIN